MAGTPLQIVVGLGNPGPEHRLTRHNAGFWFVDALARQHGAQFRAHARYQGEIAKVTVEGQELVLLKPQTYMNRSGLSIRALMDYIKAPVGRDAGRARRARPARAASRDSSLVAVTAATTACATRSRIAAPDFWRLRLGIGHPGDKSQVIDYVLQRATPADETAIMDSVEAGLGALDVFLRDGAEKAMHQLHSTAGTR